MSETPIVVFAGPSLPDMPAARERLAARYPGPAARGDVLRAALLRPAAIVLIDGYFEQVPSVQHKEILWALDKGIPVYGAASLGALRALELRPFGMIGVGKIYDDFVSGLLSRDDEVALVHAPREAGYQALSEPLVNIRWTLAAAVDSGVIDEATRERLVARASAMFYPKRTFPALLEDEVRPSPATARDLGDWVETGKIDQKQLDALACLQRVAIDRLEIGPRSLARFTFNHTDAFERMLTEIARDPLADADDPDAKALERLRVLSPEGADALEAQAELDCLALLADSSSSQPPSPEELAHQVDAFRNRTGLGDPGSLNDWLAARGLDIDTLSRWLEEEARIARVRAQIAPVAGKRALDKIRLQSPPLGG